MPYRGASSYSLLGDRLIEKNVVEEDALRSGRSKEREAQDALVRDYSTVLRESALLTTFSSILFGFLFTVSIDIPDGFDFFDRVLILVALFSITVAVSLFVMPVIYHHVQYPYSDIEKFKSRSHRFIVFGIVPALVTLYLGLEIALSSVMQSELAFVLAGVPFAMVYIFFKMRK